MPAYGVIFFFIARLFLGSFTLEAIPGLTQPFSYFDSILFSALLYLLFYLFLLLLHEGIHAIFYQLFAPGGKVSFGFKSGFFYAASPGNFYSRFQMAIIAMAPFLLISLLLTAIAVIFRIDSFTYAIFTAVHTAACTGDFYYLWVLIFIPEDAKIEDTAQGIRIYTD